MPSLSIVIPAYNEERRLKGTLQQITEWIREGNREYTEILVVDDGSTDDTAELVLRFQRSQPCVRLLRNPGNRGKGYAVRHGMLDARSDWILYTDADLSAPIEDFQRLQHDETSLPARELVRLLITGTTRSRNKPHQLLGYEGNIQTIYDGRELLRRWDCVLGKDSAGAALYEVWLQKLQTNFAAEVVPAEAKGLVGAGSLLRTMLRALKNPDGKTFGANPRIKVYLLLSNSLHEAVTELRDRLGPDIKQWRWGDLHFAEFKHPLSTDDARRAVFDLKPVSRGGDANTVNATAGARFIQRSGASFREILDLSDWDKSVAINVPGQSGQPESPHYGDLLPLWAEGKYFPLLFNREKIEKNAAERLLLEPKRSSQAATKQ